MRLLRVLEFLGNAGEPMTPTSIGQVLGLPNPTVHRLCKTLLEERFLVQEGGSRRLRPARRTRAMVAGLMSNAWVHAARHQILVNVARHVGETVNFVVPEDEGMFYLDRVETDWPFQVKLPIGSHVPFHCTASGKTYLASLSPSAMKGMIGSLKLTRQTANTHVTPDRLTAELKKIRRSGYAIDNGEFIEGMVAIAVPVSDTQGRYVASLAFHGPDQRLSAERAFGQRNILVNAAEKLSRILFADSADHEATSHTRRNTTKA